MRVKELVISEKINVRKLIEVVELANQFESEIFVEGDNYKIDAKSLMGLLATIKRNSAITIIAKGIDEEEAIKKLISLLK
ncbi:HPr family phosphocarrier protein [Metabacillus niabensis]|uniref:Phosphocarrier protein HPr n=1 Tax=Metabacillus niabensis TaxID=324854 RepID=A0ABT9YYV4_9BACI|nr:HPr family phosphocarrier protein [Metabacillus niabensis]MDQ0225174.1 phosphotransferase system HPr (HPr) family protein [Metabacillus niabensis]PAD67185.1 hypothetical protein CHH83_19925 [Bacillus sp. 7586-K]